MYISKKDWDNFVKRLSAINQTATDHIVKYVKTFGLDDVEGLIKYAYEITQSYGTASSSWTALMYNTISELEGKYLPAAELAENASYGEVAKTINGVLKTSRNENEIANAVGRLVKRSGQDTLVQNAVRDRAEFAWIPSGDTCAFCIALASRGWQPASKKALQGGHAEHIHSNCNCTYMIRHSSDLDVRGYEPEKYREMYDEAEGNTPKAKINAMRREFYAENKEEINEQKRDAYEKREELNSSEAEEAKV